MNDILRIALVATLVLTLVGLAIKLTSFLIPFLAIGISAFIVYQIFKKKPHG